MNTQDLYNTQMAYFCDRLGKPYAIKLEGEKSSSCLYRIEIDGEMCKCAIGCAIPDDNYDPDMENQWVVDIVTWDDGLKKLFEDVSIDYAYESQELHDQTARVDARAGRGISHDFIDGLKDLAHRHGLLT
jgi:hypothetical protein